MRNSYHTAKQMKSVGEVSSAATSISSGKNSAGRRPQAVIVFPAQLGTVDDYEELTFDVAEAIGLKMYTAPLSRLDWPVGAVAVRNTHATLCKPNTRSDTYVDQSLPMHTLSSSVPYLQSLYLSLHQIGLLPSLATIEYITGNLM